MRREGKQHHGKVRIVACKLPPGNGPRAAAAAAAKANCRALVSCQMLEPPPMARAYADAPAKSTNHAKHPGKCKKSKCRECHHAAAASKSRDHKGKGALKLRSSDVLLNHRLASWRVVDTAGASLHPVFTGASASELVRQLSASRHSHDADDQKADESCMNLIYGYGVGDCSVGEPLEYGYDDDDNNAEENVDYGYGDYYDGSDDMVVERFEAKEEEVIGPSSADDGEDDGDNDADTDMDYFVVGVVWEYYDGEEDWLVVQEM